MKSICMTIQNVKQSSRYPLLAALLLGMFLFSACSHENLPMQDKNDIIYVETNNYHDNQNAVIAYRLKADGSLDQIAGSPFSTRGAGLGNTAQILGPNDKETPEVIYDNKFLIAVNGGSNTIAVFKINSNGSLSHVNGSPFASGGQNPVSLAVAGSFLYVANKSQDPMHPITALPNYTTFSIAGDGSLTPVAGAKFETTAGVSPSQVLVSNDRKYVFATDFLGFMGEAPVGTLRSFKRNTDGTLTAVNGTPYALPAGNGGALGLWQHPNANVLYVGFPVAGKVGVYNINPADGSLTYQSSVTGGAATCWIRVNSTGRNMYTLNSAENTISVFNTSVALSPALLQKFPLKNSGPLFAGPMPGQMFTTSEDFHLSLSKSEKILYVVSQHTNVDFSIGNFNYLHVLAIDADGKLSEPGEPLQIPVSADIRPEGVVVYSN